ncbi:hypothetical protein [Sneathiella glossodoripedis]|uniref:hypothetical protein n=1 Tax=Sneathiella glossodoripedis TaxID=418853 RepID=UPI00046EA3FD|nr:hypothetical protein [Sneathiella glossodoripedis]
MEDELETFFEGPEPAQEAETVVEPDQQAVEPEPQAAEEEPTGVKEEDSPPEPKEEMVPIAALMAERDKRQEAERARQELEAKQDKKPDFYDDPEGALESQKIDTEQSILNMKVSMSEEIVKVIHSDYTDVVHDGTWEKLTKENPALALQCGQASNPALFAYQQCQNYKALQEIGDPKTYKDRLSAEIRAELKAEMEKEAALKNLPENLADIPTAKSKAPEWSGPESLDEILN